MSQDIDGYGPRATQSDIERLLEDCRTLSPSSVERIAVSWMSDAAGGWADAVADHRDASSGKHRRWHEAEEAALHALERSGRVREWDGLRKQILDLTENHDALLVWRAEHGEVSHRAEDALLGAAMALLARPDLDAAHERVLFHPLSGTLRWLAESGSTTPG